MKKSLIFIAMLAVSATLFAEDESISCETDLGKCTFTLSADSFSTDCTCRDGSGMGDSEIPPEGGTVESILPTEEECKAEIEDFCGTAKVICENKAGECEIETDGNYDCHCFGLIGITSGSMEVSDEACNSTLVELCGTEAATVRTLCTDAEVLNECIGYAKVFADACVKPLTDEDVEAALDIPIEGDNTATTIAVCCQSDEIKDEFKTSYECVEATESCENGECCETCDVFVAEYSAETGVGEESGSVDTGDTDVPADDSAPEKDSADGDSADGDSAPATDSEAPAENKEENKKSDGCSMLFI